ncbi:MAG: proton-conducting transporter membrane subunit [Nitriliruptoraceae bacterium]
MTTELLATIAPGAPLLAAMVLLDRRPPPPVATRIALGAAVTAAAAALLLLFLVPAGGTPLWNGLLSVARPGLMIALLAATIAALVIAFAGRAFAGDGGERRFARLASLLTAGTITLALAGNIIVLAIAWIVVGQALVGLLGHRATAASRYAVRQTRRALLVGDGALLVASAVVLGSIGVLSLHGDPAASVAELTAISVPGIDAISWLDVVAVLVVVAAISRSALVPLHRWLPTTLAAPTPVSALLHAGVVNGAGVLLLALAPVFGAAPAATALAFGAGTATAVLAMAIMLVRTDVKGGLAWSTAGQMGFMVVQLAIGAFGAALFHLVGHGLYKAAAFLGAGGAIGAHAQARHHPRVTVAPSQITRRLAVVLLPTVGVALVWWGLDPGFSPAKTLLVVAVAWLLAAHLVAGWLRIGPLGVGGSLAAAAVGVPVVAGGYLGALIGFERFVSPALPPVGDAVVGVVPLAVVLGATGAVALLLALLPESAPLRVRVHAMLTGVSIRPVPVAAVASSGPGTARTGGVPAGAVDHSRQPTAERVPSGSRASYALPSEVVR